MGAEQIQDPMVSLLLGGTEGAEVMQDTIASREVTVITDAPDAGPDSVVYVVNSGEVVWMVIADDDSLEEVIAALP